MMPKPKLSLVAQAGISELRRDHGIEPTLDEIIWLHELGKAQEAAGRIDGIIDGPAQAGNAFLWPLTVMGAQWYRNYADRWFAQSHLYGFYAYAFALAHGRGLPIPDTAKRGWAEKIVRRVLDIREKRTLADLQDRQECIEAITLWAGSTGATRKELEAAVDFVMPKSEEQPKDEDDTIPPGINFDAIVHELAIISGTDPDYWRSRTSKDETIRAFHNVISIERARRGESGPPIRDALTVAINNFRKAICAIINAHKTSQETPR